MEEEIRKNQTTLIFSGLAFIAFGIWSGIKLTIYMSLNNQAVRELVNFDGTDTEFKVVLAIITAVIVGFSLLLHFYIGLRAVRDARGTLRRRAYVVVTAAYVLLIAEGHIYSAIANRSLEYETSNFVSIIIDTTSIIALVLVILSSHRLRKLRAQEAIGE